MIRFDVPGTPASPNATLTWHWGKRAKVNKGWYDDVWASAFGAGALSPHGFDIPRRRVTFTRVGGRQLDPDNASGSMKPILDGLVRAGLLVDDSPQWCDLRPVEWRRKKRGEQAHVEICIEDCEGTP